MSLIHLVTVLTDPANVSASGSRTWGWFPNAEAAAHALATNLSDMHETIYRYAVVETYDWGVPADAESEIWFEWARLANDGKGGYMPGVKPADFEGAVNFGMG